MVFVEVMLRKCVNWTTMTAHSLSQIIRKTIDILTNVDWNRELMYHAIMIRLLRQGLVALTKAPPSL
jgi:hypothetical protein